MKKLLFKGPVATSSGYGVHSRQLLLALLESGKFDVSVVGTTWGQTSFILDDSPLMLRARELMAKFESERQRGVRYDVSVQVTIPNEFERIAQTNIGVTAGIEVDRISPTWIQKINENIDLVVVPSQHSFDSLTKVSYRTQQGEQLLVQKPVVICHEGVDTEIFNCVPGQEDEKASIDLIAPFNFLFVGLGLDKGIGEDRKNLSLLIKWFCERFKDDATVGLVLKSAIVNGSLIDFNHFSSRVREIKALAGCGRYPTVQLIHGRMSDWELASLYRHPQIKAMVSLTHGEGFGLPMLEAAACGLPIVATNWSGHLDFLAIEGRKKFVPVEYDMGEIPDSCVWNGVMEKGTRWANPREDDAKLKLKKVALSYDKPKEWAVELADYVGKMFSLRATGLRFSRTIQEFVDQHVENNPRTEQEAVTIIRRNIDRVDPDGGKRLLYTMPMSAGDVYISTGVVDSLKKKFPDHKIFFATEEKYSTILKGNPNIYRVIHWEQWMMNVPLCEQIFDEVYTPNTGIQLTQSNWIRKGKGRLLGREMAHQCDVAFGEYFIECDEIELSSHAYIVVNPGSGKGQWEARNYLHWQEVITNLKNLSGLPVVQVGTMDDPAYKDVVDFRGKTTYNQLATVVKSAAVVVGIDSVTSHLAAGLGVPQVSLYGSSYSTSTGPVITTKMNTSILMDTPNRYTCDRACYKYQCSVDKDHPCINEISPRSIVENVLRVICNSSQSSTMLENMSQYKEIRPTISGYTHVLNPERQGFPYMQSVRSMLGFCDQVVVVDGGSDDGSSEKLKALAKDDPRLEIIDRKWDWEEPGMDGMQKAFGRAMCTGDFLWQQDADEVVHEDDYEKIRKLVKRFPSDVDLIHLPVVELWGDDRTARTDRHSWKWRLSRNNFRITHGINRDARVVDDKSGKTYARKGMSDGCEYIDVMEQTYIQHKGFYGQELDDVRRTDPTEYGQRMNKIFEEWPSVYHYSWADIPRKIRNFRDFWDRCWANIYNDTERERRFFKGRDWETVTEAEIEAEAARMVVQGGEHGKAPTFKLDRPAPASMR